MAPIQFRCSSCQGLLKVSNPALAGKKIKCPKCGAVCPVPLAEEPVEITAAALPPPPPEPEPLMTEPADEPPPPRRPRPVRRRPGVFHSFLVALILLLLYGYGVAAVYLGVLDKVILGDLLTQFLSAPVAGDIRVAENTNNGQATKTDRSKSGDQSRTAKTGTSDSSTEKTDKGGPGHGPKTEKERPTDNGTGKQGKVEELPGKAGEPGEIAVIPADAQAAAIVVRPRRLLQVPLLAGPLKNQLAEAKKYGVDLDEIEHITLLLTELKNVKGKGKVEDRTPFVAATVHLTAAGDGKKLLQAILQKTTPAEIDGKKIEISEEATLPGGDKVAGHVVDRRTVLLAPTELLKQMLTAPVKRGEMAEALRKLDPQADVGAVIFMKDYRAPLKALLAPVAKNLPETLKGLAELPDQVSTVYLTLRGTGEPILTLSLKTSDALSATSVEETLKTAVDLGRTAYPALRKEFGKQVPPEAAPFLGIADQVVEGLSVSRDGDHVLIQLKKLALVPGK